MRFELYKESSGTYYYRLIGDFFRFIIMSECYLKKEAALKDIETAKASLVSLDNIDIKKTAKEEYYFEVKNKEGRVVGSSCLFKTVQALREKLNYVKPKINKAPVIEKI